MVLSGAQNPYDDAAKKASNSWFPYIKNRQVWVTPFDTISLNLPGYLARIRKSILYAVVFGILCLTVACIAAYFASLLSPNIDPLRSFNVSVSSATGVTHPVYYDTRGLQAGTVNQGEVETEAQGHSGNMEPPDANCTSAPFQSAIFIICLIEVALIGLMGMVFSGAYAQLFLTPVNCIKVAPFAIIQRKEIDKEGLPGEEGYATAGEMKEAWFLSTRIWICLPQNVYLHNFTLSVHYTYSKRYSESALNPRKKNPPTLVARKSYTAVRGVWSVDIPLEKPRGKKLIRAFMCKENPKLQLLLQGTTSSGEIIFREALIDMPHIVCDRVFAPYEKDAYDKMNNSSSVGLEHERFYNYGAFFKLVKAESQGQPSDPLLRGFIKSVCSQQRCKDVQKKLAEYTIEWPYDWRTHLSYMDLKELRSL